MANIHMLYGNEAQLMEERKLSYLRQFDELPLVTLQDEVGPNRIMEQLSEDSLFGDSKVFCLVNPGIIKKSGKNNDAWASLRTMLMNYTGDNPVLILYHDTVDKRLKENKDLLAAIPNEEFKRLEGGEMVLWMRNYCQANGYQMTPDALEYISQLLEIWVDVPVSFMRTELDRFFLLLGDQKQIDKAFLAANVSDYGSKNIFTFKDALLERDAHTLLELFPFIFSYKEVDRAMSYIEGQLRLQLMVSECRAAGMTERQVQDLFKNHQSKTKSYPIKLAYQAAPRIPRVALRRLLRGLYEVIADSRTGQGDLWRFKDLCLSYCAYREES
ncbi:MAG: DNA polymerase III subunit delta [Veillonella sp.]|nr:DNA polymerase III subunit delta [Veillonella sp.]